MSTLADLLILNLGARFTKLLVESWLGKGAGTTIVGDVVDILKGRIQSTADQKKAKREFEELGDRMARELLPLFEAAEKRGHLNVESVVFALEATMAGLMTSRFLVQKDLDSGAILGELKQIRPLPTTQFSQAETDLYERALERSVRHLVEVASRLPDFEEAFAARSLHQLSLLTADVHEVLAGVHRIEVTVGAIADNIRSPFAQDPQEYEKHYRHKINSSLNYLPIAGLSVAPEFRRSVLTTAYTPPTLEYFQEGKATQISANEFLRRLNSWEGGFLVRGEAGSGKTALMRWIAVNAAKGLQPIDTCPGVPPQNHDPVSGIAWESIIPLLIDLQLFRGNNLSDISNLPLSLAGEAPPSNWVESIILAGRALFLFDGIDKVPRTLREAFRIELRTLLQKSLGCVFIVTTRVDAVPVSWLGDLGFREARIKPMSATQRGLLIDRWFHAAAEKPLSFSEPDRLPELAASLKIQLSEKIGVATLAENPLLCALICASHRQSPHQFPMGERSLCEDLLKAISHQWEQEEGVQLAGWPEAYINLDYSKKRSVLRDLAYKMISEDRMFFTRADLITTLKSILEESPEVSHVDAEVLGDSIIERTGIIEEHATDTFSFAHDIFKELLASDRIAQAPERYSLLLNANSLKWQSIIVFASSHRGILVGQIIRNLLSATYLPDTQRKTLALRCGAAALSLDAETKKTLRGVALELLTTEANTATTLSFFGRSSVIDLLRYDDSLSETESRKSVEALQRLRTPLSLAILRDYRRDHRPSVARHLATLINPLEIELVLESVINGTPLLEGVGEYIVDLTPLEAMHEITSLHLDRTKIIDLRPIAGLVGLIKLSINDAPVEDILPLCGLKNLDYLSLSGTLIKNLVAVAGLRKLRHLDASVTRVSDLTPLAELSTLENLELVGTNVSDLSPLASLKGLRFLDIRGTRVQSIDVIKKLGCDVRR